jgi:hypothetical protein
MLRQLMNPSHSSRLAAQNALTREDTEDTKRHINEDTLTNEDTEDTKIIYLTNLLKESLSPF